MNFSTIRSAPIFLVLIFFFSSPLNAQSYFGAFTISDATKVPYYLSIDNPSGVAYSVSGIYSNTETLSLVSFFRNSNNIIDLKEGNVIYTKLRPENYSDFCALSFSFSNKQLKKPSLSSTYSAALPSGILCGEGKIELESIDNLKKKLSDINVKLENNFLLKSLTSAKNRDITINKLDEVTKLLNENYIAEIVLYDLDYIDFLYLKKYHTIKLEFDLKNRALDQKLFSFENCDSVFNANDILLSRTDLTKPITVKIKQTLDQDLFFSISEIESLALNFKIVEGKEHVVLEL